jgi:subtilase family serine protease
LLWRSHFHALTFARRKMTGLVATGGVAILLTAGVSAAPAASSASAATAFQTYTTFHTFPHYGGRGGFRSPNTSDVGYTPSQIQTAYDVSPLLSAGVNGTGQTIALIEFDRFTSDDLATFDSTFGLPAPSIKQYYLGGATAASMPQQGEATLDVEWAHALAPNAAIQVYNIPNVKAGARGWKLVARAVTEAAANGSKTISLSFGACGATSGYKTLQTALSSVLANGVSVFVASGDDGALSGPAKDCGGTPAVGYPASDPSVVAVGGTSLLIDQTSAIGREISWNLSGGGKGKPLARPVWQVTPNLKPGKFRYAPDVSFLADPSTGVSIYFQGQWQAAGGTSLGAPAWAGIWSLVNESAQNAGKTIQPAPQSVYAIGNSSAYASAFHDITSGNNGLYRARVGWDAVTGWGTPNVATLSTDEQSTVLSTKLKNASK